MRGTPDPYELLGVNPTATADEIRRAWRKAARDAHPDHHPDDPTAEARFKALARAYEVLGDPERRAAWDRSGGRLRRGPVGTDVWREVLRAVARGLSRWATSARVPKARPAVEPAPGGPPDARQARREAREARRDQARADRAAAKAARAAAKADRAAAKGPR
jgi:curved DNA-binding protein CbpA